MNEVDFENLHFTVLNVEDRRIGKVRVEIRPIDESAQTQDKKEEKKEKRERKERRDRT